MSLIHPGASINFDGTDLQGSEEEEIQQEDIKQQREVSTGTLNIIYLNKDFILSWVELPKW